MRNTVVTVSLFAVLCSCSSMAAPAPESPSLVQDSAPNLDLRGAEFHFDRRIGDDDDEFAIGISLDHGSLDSHDMLGLDYGLLYSRLDHPAISSSTLEAHLGLLFTPFESKAVRPYLGAGVGFLTAGPKIDLDLDEARHAFLDVRDIGNSFGGYARLGVAFGLGDNVELGIEGRTLFGAEIDVGSQTVDADYTQFGLWLGYRF